jgi:hypothetical protein
MPKLLFHRRRERTGPPAQTADEPSTFRAADWQSAGSQVGNLRPIDAGREHKSPGGDPGGERHFGGILSRVDYHPSARGHLPLVDPDQTNR